MTLRPFQTPALDAWHAELRRDEGTSTTFDPLTVLIDKAVRALQKAAA